MADLDLDARREALGVAPVLTFKGEKFPLSVEMPYALVDAYEADVTEAQFCETWGLECLGEKEWARFKSLKPSLNEVKEISRHNFWGVNQGESEASDGSSPNTGDRSRPTSSASTASTSAKRSAKAQKQSAPAA